MTDEDGNFQFLTSQAEAATHLTITRLGYRALSEAVAESDTLQRYVMDPEAIDLDEVVVTAIPEPCPNVEDEAARKAWEVARDHYAEDTAQRGMAAKVLARSREMVRPDRVRWIQDSQLTPNATRWVGATETRSPGRFWDINEKIATVGYAERTRFDEPPWDFVSLAGRHAHHFISEVFGEAHTFSVVRAGNRQTILSFCGKDRDDPWLEGALTLDSDTTVTSASWTLTTPDPERRTGGEVLFAGWAGAADEKPHLMPARSMSWTFDPHWDRYDVTTVVYEAWSVSTDAEMPEWPDRR